MEGATESLVLLRATDIAVSARTSQMTKLQGSSLTSTVAIFRAGVNKMYQYIERQDST